MTSDDERDPPRLRRLQHELPAELSLALESLPEEEATPAELEAFKTSVARARASERARAVVVVPPRRPPIFRRSMALTMTLAIGAGAGVAVSGGVFLATRDPATSTPTTTTTTSSNQDARTAAKKSAAASTDEQAALPSPSAAPEPMPILPERTRPRTTAADQPPPPSSAPDAGAPQAPADRDELALLARAQAALATDPGTALSLAATHAQTFPGGALAQEREVIAIDALLRLGRKTEGTARAKAFHQQFPASAHGRRVDVLVGVHGGAGENHN